MQHTLWGSFAKVASRGAACWPWMREAVFSAGLKRRAWRARSRARQRKTARIRYSGNLSAVGGENSQGPDYSQWDTLAPTGDILGKNEKRLLRDLLSLVKILSGREKDLQELAGWCSAFEFQEEENSKSAWVLKSRTHLTFAAVLRTSSWSPTAITGY